MIVDEFIFNGILYALAIFGGLSLLSITCRVRLYVGDTGRIQGRQTERNQ
jgi:hypothetical protein